MNTTMPYTPMAFVQAGFGLAVLCKTCGRQVSLDLKGMIAAGKGTVDLADRWVEGRLKCKVCGSTKCELKPEIAPAAPS